MLDDIDDDDDDDDDDDGSPSTRLQSFAWFCQRPPEISSLCRASPEQLLFKMESVQT